jgi:flagellar biosynthesis activator protein FlaF
MQSAPIERYRNVQQMTLTGRELEAAVLTKAAQKLTLCQNNWEAPDREENMIQALRYNQQVWTVFQSELASPENPLPKKLKEDLLSLSAFIDKRIFEIMSFPAPEKLSAIININLNIAAGLSASGTRE